MKNFLLLLLGTIIFGYNANAQSASFRFEAKSQKIIISVDTAVQHFIRKQPGFKNLTPQQQEFYYYTNYSRINPRRFWDSAVKKVIDSFPDFKSDYSESLRKDLYASPALPLLSLNDTLVKMATWLATDNMKSGMPSHTSSKGEDFGTRFKNAGVITRCGGENLSWGNLSPLFALISLYIDKDLPQLGHRKALLNPLYTQIGVGAVPGPNDSYFYVQDFACDKP